MPNPKRRHSRARTGKRRAHDHVVAQAESICSHCSEGAMPHRVCPKCGYYRDRQVIEVESE